MRTRASTPIKREAWWQMKTVDRLIEGLQILKRYEPDLSPYPSHRARRVLQVQEIKFGEISEADRTRLRELGWEGAAYEWVF